MNLLVGVIMKKVTRRPIEKKRVVIDAQEVDVNVYEKVIILSKKRREMDRRESLLRLNALFKD